MLVADRQEPVTFFCAQQDEWGAKPSERDLIVRLHRTREDMPTTGVVIDATRPLAEVVDEILRRVGVV